LQVPRSRRRDLDDEVRWNSNELIGKRRQRTRQEQREIGLATAPRADGELRRGTHDEAAAAACPGTKGGGYPRHDELVQERGQLLPLEHPVDQLALDVLVEGCPLLERHRLRRFGFRGTAAHCAHRSTGIPGSEG